MTVQNRLFNFFLWWAVIGYSIWVGGTLFSMSVVVPMWSEDPPQSVTEFFGHTSFNKHIFNFFGPPWMAIRIVPSLLALILGWGSKPHRRFLLITVIVLALGITFTLVYIYPINARMMLRASAGLSAEQIKSLAGTWILADRLRFTGMLVGYFFLLKAFRLQNLSHG